MSFDRQDKTPEVLTTPLGLSFQFSIRTNRGCRKIGIRCRAADATRDWDENVGGFRQSRRHHLRTESSQCNV